MIIAKLFNSFFLITILIQFLPLLIISSLDPNPILPDQREPPDPIHLKIMQTKDTKTGIRNPMKSLGS